MEENKTKENTSGPWWKPAMQIFSDVSTWIVVPIICALIFGKMLDAHFGTKPIIFLSLALLAFLISCFKIVLIIKDYAKTLKDLEANSKKEENTQDKFN